MAYVWGTSANAANNASGTSLTGSVTYAAHDRAQVWQTYGSATRIVESCSDGTNTYAYVTTLSDATNGQSWALFECLDTAAGTFTITFGLASAAGARGLAAFHQSGLANSGSLQNIQQVQASPGTGANALTSTNLTPASQPGMLLGLAMDDSTNGAISAGGTFTDEGALGNWDTAFVTSSRAEDKRLILTAAVAATFTASAGTDRYAAWAIFIPEAAGAVAAQPPLLLPLPHRPVGERTGKGGLIMRVVFPRLPSVPPPLVSFTHTATGGLTFAGAAAASQTAAYTAAGAGGLTFAGAAAASQTANYAMTAGGGLVFAGAAAASQTSIYSMVAAGGLLFAGTAAASQTAAYAMTASGGLIFAGAASVTYTAAFSHAASGGIVFGGSAAASAGNGFVVTAAGGLQFGGAASASATAQWVMTASGGLAFSGAAANSQTSDYAAAGAGGLSFGGAAGASQTAAYAMAATGGLVFGGHAPAQSDSGFSVVAVGGILFGGTATVNFVPVIRARIPADGEAIVRRARPAAEQRTARPDALSTRRRRN